MFRRLVYRTNLRADPPHRVQRRTDNPYHQLLTDKNTKYGKFRYLFDEPEDPQQKYDDKYDKHQQIVGYGFHRGSYCPAIPNPVFIAPNASLIGNVQVHRFCSIWYGCVVRGDNRQVVIGMYTNIQDNTVIQDYYKDAGVDNDGSTIIGGYNVIGHSCQIRAATVDSMCIVGSHSVLMENSYMEAGSHLGAGSVLYPGQKVPQGELWIGNPAKFVRKLTEDEIGIAKVATDYYYRLATKHKDEFYISDMQHYELEKLGISISAKGFVKEGIPQA